MSDALLDIVGVVPAQMVFAYALVKMLDIRKLPLYWVLELVIVLFVTIFRSSMSVEFRLAASIPLALVPLVLSKGPLPYRILVVALAHLVMFFLELPFGALWVAITDTPIADYPSVREHLGAFFFVHAVHLLMLALLLAVLYMILVRFGGGSEGRGRAAWLPTAFTAVQLVLATIVVFLPFGPIKESLAYYAVGVSLSLVCFTADLLLFVAMDRYAQKQSDDERARILEGQLDRYLAQYEGFVRDIEYTLKLRHDLGNHLQVIRALSEREKFQDGRAHLNLVRRALADSGKDEGVAT